MTAPLEQGNEQPNRTPGSHRANLTIENPGGTNGARREEAKAKITRATARETAIGRTDAPGAEDDPLS